MRVKLMEAYRINRTLRVSMWLVVLSGAILFFKGGSHSSQPQMQQAQQQQAPQQSSGWPFNQGQGNAQNTNVSQVQGQPTGKQMAGGQVQIQGAAILPPPPKPIELDAVDTGGAAPEKSASSDEGDSATVDAGAAAEIENAGVLHLQDQ